MTIKAKLIANVILLAAIIGAISLSSYLSMSFLKVKLTQLTEKSAPFQIQTLDLQRELQKCIATLVRLNYAQTLSEYNLLRSEAEISLDTVDTIEKKIATLKDSTLDKYILDELDTLALELFNATQDRLTLNSAATEANKTIQHRLTESGRYLNELDQRIQLLRNDFTRLFTESRADTARLSARLTSIEDLRNLVRDLQLLDITIQNSQKSSTLRIARGRLNAINARIVSNDYYKSSSQNTSLISGIFERVNDYTSLLKTNITQKELELAGKSSTPLKEISSKLNDLFQTLDQDSILARQELLISNNLQASLFNRSKSANHILEIDSQLVALGQKIATETNRLFTLTSEQDILALSATLHTLFSQISTHLTMIKQELIALDRQQEIPPLTAASSSLSAIQEELYKTGGIIPTLEKRAKTLKHADTIAVNLREIVAKQAITGKESIAIALSDQEKSIKTVNNTIRKNLTNVVIIGLSAVVIGLIFGLWIYRTVLLPLQVVYTAVKQQQKLGTDKALLVAAVADGDLSREVHISSALQLEISHINNDEVGAVLKAIKAMSETQVTLDKAFASMTESLRRTRSEEQLRDHIKSGLVELNKILRVEQNIEELGKKVLTFVASFLSVEIGLLYSNDGQAKTLNILACYATSPGDSTRTSIKHGEGLIGQSAREQKIISLYPVPSDYLTISSGSGKAAPHHISILPIVHHNELIGVMELGRFTSFTENDYDFLNIALEELAIALKIIQTRNTKYSHN